MTTLERESRLPPSQDTPRIRDGHLGASAPGRSLSADPRSAGHAANWLSVLTADAIVPAKLETQLPYGWGACAIEFTYFVVERCQVRGQDALADCLYLVEPRISRVLTVIVHSGFNAILLGSVG